MGKEIIFIKQSVHAIGMQLLLTIWWQGRQRHYISRGRDRSWLKQLKKRKKKYRYC